MCSPCRSLTQSRAKPRSRPKKQLPSALRRRRTRDSRQRQDGDSPFPDGSPAMQDVAGHRERLPRRPLCVAKLKDMARARRGTGKRLRRYRAERAADDTARIRRLVPALVPLSSLAPMEMQWPCLADQAILCGDTARGEPNSYAILAIGQRDAAHQHSTLTCPTASRPHRLA